MHTNPLYLSQKGVLNQNCSSVKCKTKSKQRGASRREQHSVQFKARVIHDVEAWGLNQEEIANKYRINQSFAIRLS